MALEPPRFPGDDDADDEMLPCGASLADIWDSGRPVPGHGDCPHCRGAVADVDALHDLVAQAVAPDPEGTGGAGGLAGHADFSARVMDVVRTELRPGPLVPLTAPEDDHPRVRDGEADGRTSEDAGFGGMADGDWISEAAAARVLRAAAECERGVSAGSCRIRPLAAPDDRPVRTARLPREPLRVRIEIAVDSAAHLSDTAERVRGRVARAADRDIGLDVTAVDVAVVALRDASTPVSPHRIRRTLR
ncbi:hypothetical protein LO772_33000 [Yinghuangia sp. ASG 101]|uniref:hypothetical protein n=1 Tax=Yinghuangia sp. ASG 101 TaxID=2896848 RepID=UPI001E599D63|nr:hypothetical protein [Yinghuangia sp. ASG 101]UGQ11544.1 hypothetical protein LO772_33000 [Yinghuangia sp. ASG 101]